MGLAHRGPGSRVAVGTAIIAVLVVLLSACGSSSSSTTASPSSASATSTPSQTSQTTQSANQFKAAIAPVLDEFKAASQKTGAALEHAGSQNDAQLATTFQELTASWAAAVTKLETLQPPAALSAAYDRLKSGVTRVKADLGAIAAAARSHDAAAAKAATQSLLKDVVSAKAAATTITGGTP